MLLTASKVSEILGDAGLTIAIGVVVVFGVLLLLVAVFQIFGAVMTSKILSELKDKAPMVSETEPAAVPAAAPAAAAAPIVGNTETVRTSPEVQNGIPAEMVAVISAAAASMAPAGKQYAVQKIRKL